MVASYFSRVYNARLPSALSPQQLQLTQAAFIPLRQGLLQSALKRLQSNWAPGTNAARERAMVDLSLNLTLSGKAFHNCAPDDIIAHAELYSSIHAGSVLPSGVRTAAPGSINTMLSHLATGLSLLGRHGPYNSLTGQGNPLDSPEVRYYRRGYQQDVFNSGYEEQSAVPITDDKVGLLLDFLDAEAARAPTPVRRLVLMRDAIAFTFMWVTSMRGDNACRLELSDFRPFAHGQAQSGSPLTFPLPRQCLSPGFRYQVEVRGTKTVRGRRAPPVVLKVPSHPKLCLLSRVSAFVAASAAPSLPQGSLISRFLVRSTQKGVGGFEDRSLTSDALNQRLSKHLKDAAWTAERPTTASAGALSKPPSARAPTPRSFTSAGRSRPLPCWRATWTPPATSVAPSARSHPPRRRRLSRPLGAWRPLTSREAARVGGWALVESERAKA